LPPVYYGEAALAWLYAENVLSDEKGGCFIKKFTGGHGCPYYMPGDLIVATPR
jgi:hypothetical protein